MPVSKVVRDKGIVLIGMAGVGKSIVGKSLASRLGMRFVDPDLIIEGKEGKPLQDIMDGRGEEYLLRIESEVVRSLDLAGCVTAPGGSIVYDSHLMAYLRGRSVLIYLYDTIENISARINPAGRGIVGMGGRSLSEVYAERSALYPRYAHLTINCKDRSMESILDGIEKGLS